MPGGALTTGANTSFVLAGGVCETDVFWAPVGATTIGADTAFVGNILDPAGITIGNASTFMVIANPPNASLECGFTLISVAGDDTIVLTGGTIPHGDGITSGTCTVTVDVTAAASGAYLNTLGPGALVTDEGDNVNTAVATLTVAPANASPTPVPALNEWGVIFFMVLAGLGSVYYLRKYRRV